MADDGVGALPDVPRTAGSDALPARRTRIEVKIGMSWGHPAAVAPRNNPPIGLRRDAVGVEALAGLWAIDAHEMVDHPPVPAALGRLADEQQPVDGDDLPAARRGHPQEIVLVDAVAV